MALSPIAFIAPVFRDFKNDWLKAYEPGTTTPKTMALDSEGATTVAKLQLNVDGFLVSSGQALVIPYLNGAYDLWLFPTEAEADANDTSNALRLADDILGVLPDDAIEDLLINDLSQAYEFTSLSSAISFDQLVQGKVLNIKIGGSSSIWDAVLLSSVVVDNKTIFASTGVASLALVQRLVEVLVFSSVSQLLSKTTVNGISVKFAAGQQIKIQGENGEYSLYTVSTSKVDGSDILLEAGVYANKLRSDTDLIQDSLDRFLRYVNTTGNSKSQPLYTIGDSISEGTLASDFSQNSYAALIRKTFNKAYNNRNYGFANFDFDVAQATTDPHTLSRSGFAGSSFNDEYFGGVMLESGGAGEFIDITYTGKDFFVVFGQQGGGGLINVTIDSVFIGTIDTSVVPGQQIAGNVASGNGTFSGALVVSSWGDHTVRLEAASAAPVRLIGMAYYEDVATTLTSPTVFNVGRSSIALSDIADDVLQAYASSGTIVLSLGVNDDLLSKPIATFEAKLDTIFTAINAIDGGVIATDFIFSKPATNDYKYALKSKCSQYNVPLFDFAELWFADTVLNKFADLLSVDGIHPSDGGHLNIARTLTTGMRLPLNTEFREKRLFVAMSANFNPLSTYEPVTSFIDGDIAHINGSVTNGTGAIVPENTLLGALAVGHRVKETLLIGAPTASGPIALEVRNNGGIYTAFGSTIAIGDWIGLTMSYIRDTTV